MPAEALSPATTASFHVQRSLRHCLSSVAELLYESGHVLETILASPHFSTGGAVTA